MTLATRVRVDILKAIAKKYTNEKESLSVSAFISRPVIHVRSKDGGSRLGVFNFSDSLVRFGANLTPTDLEEAYKRAGSAFKGQLQQNFVVLTESIPDRRHRGDLMPGASGSNLSSPRKRLREDRTAGPRTQSPQARENKQKMAKKDVNEKR